MIEAKTVVGACAALAVIGGLVVGSAAMKPPATKQGQVEIQQVNERAWSVEIKDVAPEAQQAANLSR